MSDIQSSISNLFMITLAIVVCIVIVFFETAQQYFYIKLYQITANANFHELLFTQTRKWLIWVMYAIPLWFYIKWLTIQDQLNTVNILRSIAVIITLLLLVITTMSVVEILIAGNNLYSLRVWREFFVFFMFQKTPIYSFGYTLLALMFYLYCKNNQLTVQMLKLSELNPKDLNNFYQEKAVEDNNTSVLKIKVGNTYKIVAVEDIDWIEADDYCVNIHNKSNQAIYSMRASLKSLEAILPDSFLRVHRSAIVNMSGVEEYKTQGSGLIKMKTGDEIAVAQSKLKVVNDFFNQELN